MDKEKSAEVLNTLVEINIDRIKGYKTAADITEEQDVRSMFEKFAKTSLKCKQELEIEVTKSGGKPTETTHASGRFFRKWMDFKAALTGRDREAILKSCEYGESKAVDTYQEVLNDDSIHLNSEQQTMVSNQLALIKADRDKVKSMRESLAKAH